MLLQKHNCKVCYHTGPEPCPVHKEEEKEMSGICSAHKEFVAGCPQCETPDYARGFKAGQDSTRRNNPSGCCCKFNEQDEIVELCWAHKEYFQQLIENDEK